jgi:hypothetical protein
MSVFFRFKEPFCFGSGNSGDISILLIHVEKGGRLTDITTMWCFLKTSDEGGDHEEIKSSAACHFHDQCQLWSCQQYLGRAMMSKTPGFGQVYLGGHLDKDGRPFDGGQNYRLHVPPNPPAKQFWSITLYDIDTRCLIQNKEQIADRSSHQSDLLKNADGSVDIYFGPVAPAGFEKNWIPTVPGRAWFTWFRLYAPLEPYIERTWGLPDIEKVKRRMSPVWPNQQAGKVR